MDMGRISRRDPVRKFWMPSLVAASFGLNQRSPVVLLIEPAVMNLKNGPRERVIAVRNGPITSSACFMVGAVQIWWVVSVSTLRKYAWSKEAYIDLAAPRA